jgi:hypothetical protein
MVAAAAVQAGASLYKGYQQKKAHKQKAKAHEARAAEMFRRAKVNANLIMKDTRKKVGKADVIFAKGNVEGASVLEAKDALFEKGLNNMSNLLIQADYNRVLGINAARNERKAGDAAMTGAAIGALAGGMSTYAGLQSKGGGSSEYPKDGGGGGDQDLSSLSASASRADSAGQAIA